jgi:hypothetical protein
LGSATGYQHNMLDALADRLAPALRPQNPIACGGAKPDADSDLVRAIDSATGLVVSANDRIRDLLDRLTL